jgi:hypothetical protein
MPEKNNQMSLPKTLYRYESFDIYSLSNLKAQSIYFSSPKHFNDPFDCSITFDLSELSERVFNKLYDFYLEAYPNKKQFIKRFGKSPSEKFKTYLIATLDDTLKKSKEKMLQERGVSCYSEKNDDILMWSHYSDSHKGFCLEFDTSHDPFNMATKVEYSTDFPKIDPEIFLIYEESREIMKMFTTKFSCWEHEKEWRVFHKVAGTLYGYPPEALTGIYFGAEMPKIHIEIIALVIQGQNPNVKFYRAQKSSSKFAVSFKEFTYTSFIKAKQMGLRA